MIKFIVLLTVVFSIQASAKSQQLTLSFYNASLENIFTEIRNQSDYRFIYTKEELQHSSPVTIHIKSASLATVLDLCFNDQPLTYKLTGKYVIITRKHVSGKAPVFSTITGKVINQKAEPLDGATVTIKKTKVSITTNNKGEFTLSDVEPGTILIISNVGYETVEHKWKGEVFIEIILSPKINQLSEVVINLNTGFQLIPKERATGSFSFIDNKTFNQQVSPDIMSRLEAVTNSFYVDRSTNSPGFRIRGLSSIRGPKSPLIIVDNFPFEGNIDNLNPNDIENISILKDAAAASIWGTKAGNGVIVITTKKSKFNQPITTELNINTTVITKPDLWYLPQASSSDYIDAELFLFSNGFRFADTNNISKPPFSPVYELLFKKRNGSLSTSEADAAINKFRSYDVRNDFNKHLYQTGLNQQYAITTKGGSGNHAWLLSAGFDNNSDNLLATYKRGSVRLQNTFRIAKRLLLTTGATMVESYTNSGNLSYRSLGGNLGLYPYASLADDSGNALPYENSFRLSYLDTIGGGRLLNWYYYPLTNHKYETLKQKTRNTLLNIGLDYKLTKSLTANFLYQLEREDAESINNYSVNSYYARSLINTFSQINYTTGAVVNKVPVGGIYDVSNESLTGSNFRAGINYTKQWKLSEITLIAGNEIRQRLLNTNKFRTYGYIEDPLSSGIVDNINLYPSLISGSNMQIPSIGSPYSKSNLRFVSFYGNASYTFNKKYTISASARRDASNQFGVSTNNKWTPLWSVGGKYDISQEKFFHIQPVQSLQLRLSYGYSGNVNPNKLAVTTTSASGMSPYTQLPTYAFLSFADPELRWEKVGTINAGIDFTLKGNRVKAALDYYTKKSIDLFGVIPIDYTSGIGTTVEKNVASMTTNGFDLEVNSLLVDKSIKWSLDVNFSLNKDRVDHYYITSLRGSFYVGKQNTITGIEGKPVYSMFSYKWAGLDPATGDPQGYISGAISKDYSKLTGTATLITDLNYHGSVLPTFFGSFGNTISWKEISITARLMYKFGHYFRRPGIEYSSLTVSTFQHKEIAERWQQPGDEKFTTVPSMPYPNISNRDAFYLNSQVMIEKADHIRLQYISVNYTLSKSWMKKLAIKRIDFYSNMNNIGILWSSTKSGIDPEYLLTIPPSINISFGIRTNF
ncbi:MAG: SusC/RagA family TonB-linked outer membrane protein [Chitinophagaceae bacterium]|nr:SusC/RagA family TonB-linked outer membrane protein [Chitinophagaceae bacterium]